MSQPPIKPKAPEILTPESMAAHRQELRKYDQDRISLGIATPAQIQAENSFFGSPKNIRVLGRCTDLPPAVQRIMDEARRHKA